jgi:CheY-like chemotaxis protein
MSVPKARFLVIDDDASHIHATRALLESEGYEVMTHNSGFGSTNLVVKLQPDLVLLDVNMPGLSGEDLSKLLGANPETSRVPVFFYSSNDEDLLRAAVARHGVFGYVCKGDPAMLRLKVDRFLRKTKAR